jgi:hypothetical protein
MFHIPTVLTLELKDLVFKPVDLPEAYGTIFNGTKHQADASGTHIHGNAAESHITLKMFDWYAMYQEIAVQSMEKDYNFVSI